MTRCELDRSWNETKSCILFCGTAFVPLSVVRPKLQILVLQTNTCDCLISARFQQFYRFAFILRPPDAVQSPILDGRVIGCASVTSTALSHHDACVLCGCASRVTRSRGHRTTAWTAPFHSGTAVVPESITWSGGYIFTLCRTGYSSCDTRLHCAVV